MPLVTDADLELDTPVHTWFGVGGRADALARPTSVEGLRALLRRFDAGPVRVLGDGANLLVADEGVDGLVVSFERLADWHIAEDDGLTVVLHADAGANLPRLITDTVRQGLAGLEVLAGIPATAGGAVVMNAGGAFGEIAALMVRIEALTRTGEPVTLAREEIGFSYRRSGLEGLIITGAHLRLKRVPEAERAALRERLKEVMAYKKNSQPMAERSAGCFFKNPTVGGVRLSAGMLIDRAGCKGLRVGDASVSTVHANFIVTHEGCSASDILALADEVRERVRTHHGVTLENEVVVWRRGEVPGGEGHP